MVPNGSKRPSITFYIPSPPPFLLKIKIVDGELSISLVEVIVVIIEDSIGCSVAVHGDDTRPLVVRCRLVPFLGDGQLGLVLGLAGDFRDVARGLGAIFLVFFS